MASSFVKSCLGLCHQTQDANISATGDQVILVGAASKGIIQRGFQHNAMVYKTPYAKNPFDTITDEELEEYKKVVERKQKGESCRYRSS
jgi:adducin